MRQVRLYAYGLTMLAMFGLIATPAAADGVGPYYANPSWDQTLPASTRFVVLSNFNSQAVLDRETGLVWEKSPTQLGFSSSTDPLIQLPWSYVKFGCLSRKTGGRFGWRLPTVDELASLLDPSVPLPGPALPAGHPFTNVQASAYWTATQETSLGSGSAHIVHFGGTYVGPDSRSTGISGPVHGEALGWCVRGDSHAQAY